MTEDQHGQARGPGYVVRGDVVPEDETEEARTEESKPMTRFQKVASALRGGGSEPDEEDQAATDRAAEGQVPADRTAADTQAAGAEAGGLPWVTPEDEAAMAGSPISRETAQKRDYWDDPDAAAGHEDDAVAVTSPDTPPDHQATEPDMFGTTRRTSEAPAAEGQPGAATIADIPAARAPVGETQVGEARAGAAPAGAVPVGGVPANSAPALGAEAATTGTGRHAAAAQTPSANGELRPGEATGKLGDFSDLTYGNLIPDAAHYTDQWQQIQFKFVDDPHASVTEAADIIGQVTAKTLRMYKTFLDQLIGPRAS